MALVRCVSVRRQLDALLDGTLAERRAGLLRAHVDACAECGAAFAALADLQRRLRALPEEPLPDGFSVHLRRRLAAVRPARPTSARWWLVSLPAAAAVAGFLAAAVIAAPALAPAGSAGAARALSAANLRAQAPTPITVPAPALYPRQTATTATGAAGGGSAAAATKPAYTVNAPASSTGAASPPASDSAVASTAAQSAPAALSLTLLADAPAEAVQRLGDLAVAGGGQVITTFLGSPSGAAAQGAPQPVATLDAVLPGSSVADYQTSAGSFGTILAQVADPPAATSAPVRLLVTVLAAPSAAAASSPTAPSQRTAPARAPAPGWEAGVLLAAARAAPWAGGLCALVLAAWGAVRLARRGRS